MKNIITIITIFIFLLFVGSIDSIVEDGYPLVWIFSLFTLGGITYRLHKVQ